MASLDILNQSYFDTEQYPIIRRHPYNSFFATTLTFCTIGAVSILEDDDNAWIFYAIMLCINGSLSVYEQFFWEGRAACHIHQCTWIFWYSCILSIASIPYYANAFEFIPNDITVQTIFYYNFGIQMIIFLGIIVYWKIYLFKTWPRILDPLDTLLWGMFLFLAGVVNFYISTKYHESYPYNIYHGAWHLYVFCSLGYFLIISNTNTNTNTNTNKGS